MTTKGKVLVLVSSGHGLPLKDGKVYTGAGYYLNELTVPVRALMKEGYEITFANPKGNTPQMDVHSAVPDFFGGDDDLEQYAILLVRVSIGLFFAISGANKLFVPGGTKPVYETLVRAKVPLPRQTAYFVAGVEFVGGSLATAGFLSSPACAALLIDMTVAVVTSALATIPKRLSPLNWLDDFLYLPELLYVLFFIWLICSRPGKFSVDFWLAGKLLG
jgi:putative oxidoreductase